MFVVYVGPTFGACKDWVFHCYSSGGRSKVYVRLMLSICCPKSVTRRTGCLKFLGKFSPFFCQIPGSFWGDWARSSKSKTTGFGVLLALKNCTRWHFKLWFDLFLRYITPPIQKLKRVENTIILYTPLGSILKTAQGDNFSTPCSPYKFILYYYII